MTYFKGFVKSSSIYFCRILELPQKTNEDKLVRYQKISKIAKDFEHTGINLKYFKQKVQLYGKIIISEVSVPVANKTIKPISIGGVAGGEKYIHSGVLFKFIYIILTSNFY